MKAYYKRIFCLLLNKPRKLLSLIRLVTGVFTLKANKLFRTDNSAPMPISIGIAVTYRCNLRCIQCSQWGERGWLKNAEQDYIKKELTTEEFKNFITDVAHFRPYLQFTGGEPLLREDIFDIIKFASSKGLLTGITTNCVLLEKKADDLVKSGVEYLYASLDGTPGDVNDAIRIGEGSSERAVRGIKAVIEARQRHKAMFPIIEVRTTLIPENQYNLLKMAKFVDAEIKPDVYCIMPEFFATEEMAAKTSEIYKREFGIELKTLKGEVRDVKDMDTEAVVRQIEEIARSRWNFKFRLCEPIGKRGFCFGKYFKEPNNMLCGIDFCGALYSFTLLEPNGNIATCASKPDYIAGNILKDSFINIWNGEKYKKIREYTKKHLFPMCTRCRHIYKFCSY